MVLMLLFFVIPAAIGMMILSAPLYTSFYSYNEMGIKILLFYAPVSIAISLFTITCSIVQGIDKQNLTLYVVLIMLSIKAAINIPLIMQFQTVGAVMGTGIALSIGVLINFMIIKKYGEFRFRKDKYKKGFKKICIRRESEGESREAGSERLRTKPDRMDAEGQLTAEQNEHRVSGFFYIIEKLRCLREMEWESEEMPDAGFAPDAAFPVPEDAEAKLKSPAEHE